MTVRVLLFASYADALGAAAVDVALPEPATVADVIGAVTRLPGGERLPRRPLVAVNERYAAAATPVRPGDEVALIPPVSGG